MRSTATCQPAGFAFAEIAVDHASAGKVERVLGALGFMRSGHHRSNPVHLWSQGAAHIVLNHGDARVADDLHGDALVSAVALEVADPARAAARAEQLLAPRIEPRHGPQEAHLAAVSAPDGTALFFCRTDDEHRAGRPHAPTDAPGSATCCRQRRSPRLR